MKLSHSLSGALRTFAYFMSSGSHYMLQEVNYLELYGNDPTAIEIAYAIYINVLELDEHGTVLNAKYAEKEPLSLSGHIAILATLSSRRLKSGKRRCTERLH